jgi:hypothetical protein
MKKLSTGVNSTLGEYKKLTTAVFGEESSAVKFLEKKIKEAPNGEHEQVLQDECQMIVLLLNIDTEINPEG